jgi:hypothetical protein
VRYPGFGDLLNDVGPFIAYKTMYFWTEKGNEKNEDDDSRKTFGGFE